MMEEIARTSEKHPLTVIGLITLVTVALLAGIPEIDTRAEMREFLPEDYPSVKTTMEIENEFGLARYQLILIRSENVTNAGAVKSLLGLEKKLMEEPVLGDYVVSVESYLDFLFSEIVKDDRLLPDNQLEPKIQSLLKRPEIRLQTLPYLTLDQKTCLVYVRVNPELEPAMAVERTAYFEDFVENHARESGALEASITGEYSISKDIGDFIQGETRALLAVAILVFIILLLVFRRFSDVVAPFAVTGLSAGWVMGMMGHFNISFFSVAVAIFPLLFGLCTSYSLHMIYRYREERSKGLRANEAAVLSVRTAGGAVFLAAVTTAIALSSWFVSDIPPLRDFGFLCVLGTLFSFLFSVTLLPAFWIIRDRVTEKRRRVRRRTHRLPKKTEPAAHRMGARMVMGVTRHTRGMAIAVGAITLLAMVLATQTTAAVEFEKFAPTGIASIETASEIWEHFPDPSDACVVLVKGDMTDPVVLETMSQIGRGALFDPRNKNYIDYSFSVADLVIWANDFSLPENSDSTKIILENLRQRYPRLDGLITPDNRAAMIVFMGRAETDADLKSMVDVVRHHVGRVGPDIQAEFSVGGMPAITADLLSEIPKDAFMTTAIAFVLIALVLALAFKSLKTGLILMAPVCLALVWGFGAFYVFGIPLNPITLLISSLIMGVGVDFSIHFVHRYEEEKKTTPGKPRKSMGASVLSVGKAMVATAAIVCGAFGVLMISRIPAIAIFGGIVALMVLFCLLTTLFVLPSVLLAFLRKRGAGVKHIGSKDE